MLQVKSYISIPTRVGADVVSARPISELELFRWFMEEDEERLCNCNKLYVCGLNLLLSLYILMELVSQWLIGNACVKQVSEKFW